MVGFPWMSEASVVATHHGNFLEFPWQKSIYSLLAHFPL